MAKKKEEFIDDETRNKIINKGHAKKVRIALLILALLQMSATIYFWGTNEISFEDKRFIYLFSNAMAALGVVAIPLSVFLIARGYRAGYLIMSICNVLNAVFNMMSGASKVVILIVFCLAGAYFGGFRIENERVRLEKTGAMPMAKRHYVIDMTISAILVLISVIMIFI